MGGQPSGWVLKWEGTSEGFEMNASPFKPSQNKLSKPSFKFIHSCTIHSPLKVMFETAKGHILYSSQTLHSSLLEKKWSWNVGVLHFFPFPQVTQVDSFFFSPCLAQQQRRSPQHSGPRAPTIYNQPLNEKQKVKTQRPFWDSFFASILGGPPDGCEKKSNTRIYPPTMVVRNTEFWWSIVSLKKKGSVCELLTTILTPWGPFLDALLKGNSLRGVFPRIWL